MKSYDINRKNYALSIKQPWAYMIISGYKTIEIRKWYTKYRGPLLIHASRNIDHEAQKIFKIDKKLLSFGGLIGQVKLTDIIEFNLMDEFLSKTEFHLNPPNWFHEGTYGFIFEQPMKFSEILRIRGKLGIFPVKIPQKKNLIIG